MAGIPYRSTNTSDPVLNRIQQAISDSFIPVAKSEIIYGVILKDIKLTLSPSDNFISHGLGTPVSGWIIIKTDTYAQIKESPTVNKLPDKQLILNTDTNCTVSMWIF
jgi:hypothetical protein